MLPKARSIVDICVEVFRIPQFKSFEHFRGDKLPILIPSGVSEENSLIRRLLICVGLSLVMSMLPFVRPHPALPSVRES